MAHLTTGVVLTFSQTTLTRLLRVLSLVLASASVIGVADETNPQEDPAAILSAARQTCESLRSGHFTMTGLLTFPVEDSDSTGEGGPNEGGKDEVKQATVKRRFEYWFDVEKDLWRIDLAPENLNRQSSIPSPGLEDGFQLVLTPDRVTTTDWRSVKHGSRSAHHDDLTSECIVFNAQSLPTIQMMTFKGERVGIPDIRTMTPEKQFSSRDSEKYTVRSTANDEILLTREAAVKGHVVPYYIIERVFQRKSSILPTRTTHIEVFDGWPKRVVLETIVEWGEMSGVFVPVRLTVRDTRIVAKAHRDRVGDFDLNWISVNQPIDPQVFELDKYARESKNYGTSKNLDTGIVDALLYPEDAARERLYKARLEELKASQRSSTWGPAIFAGILIAGLVWFVRRGLSGVRSAS